MTVNLTPTVGASSYRLGTQGFAVAAIEVNLHREFTGIFDAALDKAVRAFQAQRKLVVDGDVGPKTQTQLAVQYMGRARNDYALPSGMLLSIANLESGLRIAATNFRMAGSVDLGWCQIHLPFPSPLATYLAAVYGPMCFGRTAKALRERHDLYLSYGFVGDKRAWELAVLSHNWPAGAQQLARGNPLSTADAEWVLEIGANGVRSPAQWAERYIDLAMRSVTW